MQRARSTVSRIEFRTNLMREDAEVISLGFIVESVWDDARWMGMIYRPSLTTNEKREVNFETWPELANAGGFLMSIFKEGWASEDGAAAAVLSARYGCTSAFHVHVEDAQAKFADGLASASDAKIQDVLRQRLHQFEERLRPAHAAKVLSMPTRKQPEPVVAQYVSPLLERNRA